MLHDVTLAAALAVSNQPERPLCYEAPGRYVRTYYSRDGWEHRYILVVIGVQPFCTTERYFQKTYGPKNCLRFWVRRYEDERVVLHVCEM